MQRFKGRLQRVGAGSPPENDGTRTFARRGRGPNTGEGAEPPVWVEAGRGRDVGWRSVRPRDDVDERTQEAQARHERAETLGVRVVRLGCRADPRALLRSVQHATPKTTAGFFPDKYLILLPSANPACVAQASDCARGDGTSADASDHREQEDGSRTALEPRSKVCP